MSPGLELSLGSASVFRERPVFQNPVASLARSGVLQLALLGSAYLRTLKWVLLSSEAFL